MKEGLSLRTTEVPDASETDAHSFLTRGRQITLSCEPQELPLLRATTLSEIKRLQQSGPREDDIRGAVEADRRDSETAERTNAYWLHTCVIATVVLFLLWWLFAPFVVICFWLHAFAPSSFFAVHPRAGRRRSLFFGFVKNAPSKCASRFFS